MWLSQALHSNDSILYFAESSAWLFVTKRSVELKTNRTNFNFSLLALLVSGFRKDFESISLFSRYLQTGLSSKLECADISIISSTLILTFDQTVLIYISIVLECKHSALLVALDFRQSGAVCSLSTA